MRNVPPQAAMFAAAGILCTGAAWAGSMFFAEPEPSSIQPQQIRELAAKVQSVPAQEKVLTAPVSTGVVKPVLVAAKAEPKKSATVTQVVTRIPIVQPPAPVRTPQPVVVAAPVDPVKNLALMGVTHESNTDRAWLVDLASREKESVPVGGSAFGFTVKKIAGETVTLSRGRDEYTLRLGEKQLPVIVASASTDGSGGSDDGDDGNPFGRGRDRDGRDGRSPFGGPGGPGGFDFRSRFAGGFPGFGGSSSGWSGRSWGGGDSGSSRWSSSGDRGSDRGSDRSRWSSGGGSSFGGSSWGGGSSFGGGSWGGGGFSGGGWSGSSGRSSQTGFAGATSTSNPQTSRRNGARLTGGVTSAQETPAAITNPQTARRNGGSTGQAFGQESNSNNRNGRNSSTSGSRLGYGR